jgi:hypothetical protein
MSAIAVAPGVVARWTSRRRPAAGALCDECSSLLIDVACGCCGQLGGRWVAMLATVVDTATGPRLVIAERAEAGDWVPVRTLPATADNVHALARPGATGPTAPAAGGLL